MKKEKTIRQILQDHDKAVTQIELTEAAIKILERMEGPRVARAVKLLKQDQQFMLKQIDATAAQLGAPYPDLQL
jgi:uncharacterized protein with PIN domain